INLRWVLGLGYVDAWRTLHRAEEALIEVEPTEGVILNAKRDRVSIQGSTISNRDELLNELMQATTALASATTTSADVLSKSNQNSRLSAEARAALREVRNTSNN